MRVSHESEGPATMHVKVACIQSESDAMPAPCEVEEEGACRHLG